MKNRQLFIIGWIFMLLSITGNTAGKQPYRFHTFSPEGGFYYNGINSIVQNKDGLVWFIIDNDLYRFDGYTHKNYHKVFSSDTSRNLGQTPQFNSISTDDKGNIYAGTNSGLYIYEKRADTFCKVNEQAIANLHIDAHDNLWMTREDRKSVV